MTELSDLKNKKPAANNNLLTMSENEIEKQKNQIQDEGEDLFKGFE